MQEYPAGIYTLSVVRLADPLHAVMGMLNVSVGKQSWTVCGSNSTLLAATNGSSGQVACDPSQPMQVNVSANAEVVMLQPTLLMPGVSPSIPSSGTTECLCNHLSKLDSMGGMLLVVSYAQNWQAH